MDSQSPRADLVDDGISRLRSVGARVTKPRRAVLEALASAGPHPDAEALAKAARQIDSSVHLATVYRTLDALEDLGVITHIHLGHGRSTYHLPSEMHHHAVCTECGVVIEIADEPLGRLADEVRSVHGFVLDTLHFALVGRCARCLPEEQDAVD